VIGQPEFDDFGDDIVDAARTKLNTLALGERFAFEFDLGDGWTHLCTVGDESIDPVEAFGITPREPLPYFECGAIPDQYGRESGDVCHRSFSGERSDRKDLHHLVAIVVDDLTAILQVDGVSKGIDSVRYSDSRCGR
jgi:hypothetical protein